MNTITLAIFSIIFFSSCSKSSERSMSNQKNINKITIGMKLNQVKGIMGIPDQILINPFNDKEFDAIYIAPSNHDDDFHVYVLRKDSTVVRIAKDL